MKKSIYAILGTATILSATALNRFAGGGVDLALLVFLGLALLLASADVPTTRKHQVRDGP